MKPRVPAAAVAQALAAGVAGRARIGRMPTVGAALIVPSPTVRERVALVLRGWEMSRRHGVVFYRLRRVQG